MAKEKEIGLISITSVQKEHTTTLGECTWKAGFGAEGFTEVGRRCSSTQIECSRDCCCCCGARALFFCRELGSGFSELSS
jgi:hypothetical protein